MSEESREPTPTGKKTTGQGHGKLLLAGLVGSVVGAVGALLLAPWRGTETRQKVKEGAAKLKESALKAKDSAAKAGATAKERAQSVLQRAKREEED